MRLHTPLITSTLLCAAATSSPLIPAAQRVLEHPAIDPSTIVAALKQSEIIPQILPASFNPNYQISLTYPSVHEEVLLGNILDPAITNSRPVLQISPLYDGIPPTRASEYGHANKTYTLVLSDPDATSRAHPVKGQMCHWVVTGIVPVVGNDHRDGGDGNDVERPESPELRDFTPVADEDLDVIMGGDRDLVEYLPPAPPPRTGLHRYVFVLLESESQGGCHREIKGPKDRPRWGFKRQGEGVMKWARKNRLVPVGANFFYAQNGEQ